MVTVKTTGPRIQTVDSASGPRVDPILDIVVEMLDTEGYEAVQLREVARRARVSLATIYKRYPTRDELIVAALEGWMDANRYARLPSLIEDLPGGSIYVDLMHVMRTIFEPWERHPLMLRSYFQARSGPGENASSSAVSMPSSRSPKPFWPKPIRGSPKTSSSSCPASCTGFSRDSLRARSTSPRSCPASSARCSG